MGFRKSTQARIFVDENIPSFLKARPDQTASPAAGVHSHPFIVPPAAPVQLSAPTTKLSQPQAPQDRRQQPLQLQPSFMVKAVSMAVLINAVLYISFQSPILYQQTLPMQSAVETEATPVAADPMPSHAPVVSYRYSNRGLVESP